MTRAIPRKTISSTTATLCSKINKTMPYLLIEMQHRLFDYNAILLHDDFCFLLLTSGILGMDDVDT